MSDKSGLWLAGFGVLSLGAAVAAPAQDGDGNGVIGPPQLKDFRLPQGERSAPLVIPPPTTAPSQRPVELAPAPPPAASPSPTRPGNAAARRPATEPARQASPAVPGTSQPVAPSAGASGQESADRIPEAQTESAPVPIADTVPETVAPAPVAAPPAEAPPAAPDSGSFGFLAYAVPAALLALLGIVLVRRRRRVADQAPVPDVRVPAAAPPKPRPDPMPRPWLELTLKAERASFTPTEAVVLFELEIANKGKAPARDLRIDVKMFNAGAEQDKEIGSFFKTAGRETTKLKLPAVEAGVTGVIQGSVRMAVEDIRAMRLDEKLLFIPVVAVNALYDWGENRTGQTSRSYIVGRELQEASEKMGAFRVDQGPRVWRAVGQREHRLTKRV
ncbi:hypothetical protein [Sphingosinicella terrae]|uniref:hypothetical protein n=1 Tax=Sphingosinicella terrae TaxID=2172047 RepID=UPI0013B3BA0F|nr:hypothetical protein [Sphingosinicella terrae]